MRAVGMADRWLWAGAVALLVACGGETADGGTDEDTTDAELTEVERVLALTGDVTAGEGIYTSNCQLCHAADGTGGTGTDLTAWTASGSEEEAVTAVLAGKGTMPSYRASLSEQDVADVVAYIFDSFGG